jgi:hypothetical protein
MKAKEILDQIEKSRSGDFIFPDYSGYCFSNIPSAVLHSFGIAKASPLSDVLNAVGITPGKPKKMVLFLIDALGYNRWIAYAHELKLLRRFTEKGMVIPLNSG